MAFLSYIPTGLTGAVVVVSTYRSCLSLLLGIETDEPSQLELELAGLASKCRGSGLILATLIKLSDLIPVVENRDELSESAFLAPLTSPT